MSDGPVMRNAQFMGARVRRVEDPRFLRGAGAFLADLSHAGGLDVAIVRSPHASARILGVDVPDDVRAQAVAVAVGTDPDILAAALAKKGLPTQPILAVDRVRYVGEPVAAVAAASRYLAEDLADRITVRYAPERAVATVDQALDPSAPEVHPGGNVFHTKEFSEGDVDGAFARAARVVRSKIRTQRHTAASMEGRGAVAAFAAGRLTLSLSTQHPHASRGHIARLLRLSEERVRVIMPDVGGAFGMKAGQYPEELICCVLAMRLGRPVRWVSDRRESLVSDAHARDNLAEVEAAVDGAGRILGVRAKFIADGGAYQAYPESAAPGESEFAAEMFPGPYDFRAYAFTAQCTYTHRTPVGAYRGVWGPIATLAQEGMIEAIARATGVSGIDVRRINLIESEAMPYTNVTGQTYESGSYRESLELAARTVDLAGLPARKAEAEKKGLMRGIGLSLFVEPTAFAGFESAHVEVVPSGGVIVSVGTAPSGQGHETAFAQLAAGVLGVPMDQVEVRLGDTAQAPYGGGTGGSRSLALGGGAVVEASDLVAAKARRIAAKLLEASPDDVVLEDGGAHVSGVPAKAVAWRDIARVAYQRIRDLPDGDTPGLEATTRHRPGASITYANGCHAAEVEIDPETGRVTVVRYVAVEDCGPQLNPTLVEGQIHGGVAQGVGSTFLEHLVYGEDGQPQATTFLDYLLPTATEVPEMKVLSIETPSPHTVFGMKGVGEAALIAAPACLALAVADALGVPVERLPLTPDVVWHAVSGRRTVRQPSAAR